MRSNLLVFSAVMAVVSLLSPIAGAVELDSTQSAATAVSKTNPSSTQTQSSSPTLQATAEDTLRGQMWRLSVPEIQRARLLMQGPRGSFSSSQLSPVEALGIHAQTEAERTRYARLFAQISFEDTQRVMAWTRVAEAELRLASAGEPVISFDNAPKSEASFEAADILGVPRSAVVPRPSLATPAKPKLAVNQSLGRATDNRGRPVSGRNASKSKPSDAVPARAAKQTPEVAP